MSVTYEGRVIDALLKNGDMISILGEPMDSLMESHKDIWDFVKNYYQKYSELPTPGIVKEEFGDDFEHNENIEGATRHHIDTLRKKKLEAASEHLAKKFADSLASREVEVDKLLAHLQKRISDIQREAGVARVVDVRDHEDAVTHYKKVKQLSDLHDGRPGIPFGFEHMDEAYPTGMSAGHLIIALGYSGLGKTWFVIKLAINAWLNGYSPLIINLEMSPEELRDRIYFLISHYSMTDLVRANIDPDQFQAWAKEFMKNKPEFNLVGNDTFGSFSVDMVHSKIEQYKPDIVFLDYMGLFSDRAFSTDEKVRMKNLSRELKQLGTACKIPVVAISAVTGKDKKDRATPPHIAQVAWSSGIEYDANHAFAIHTHFDEATQKPVKTEIVCRKNRHGSLYDFFVKMNLEDGTIEEIPDAEQVMLANGDDGDAYLDED